MKVFTFFYNRFDTATTSIALDAAGIEHTVLCHSSEDADRFRASGTAKGKIIATQNGKGLSLQRNFALSMMRDGEWAWFLSDDFRRIFSLPEDFIRSKTSNIPVNMLNQEAFRLTKKEFETGIGSILKLGDLMSAFAEANGVHLVGLKSYTQPLVMNNKWQTRGLVDGRMYLVQKTKLRFDESIRVVDDYAFTAANYYHFGKTLSCNWILPEFERMSAGGWGDQIQRREIKIQDCRKLVSQFSPILGFKKKVGHLPDEHISFSVTKQNLAILRERMRNLNEKNRSRKSCAHF